MVEVVVDRDRTCLLTCETDRHRGGEGEQEGRREGRRRLTHEGGEGAGAIPGTQVDEEGADSTIDVEEEVVEEEEEEVVATTEEDGVAVTAATDEEEEEEENEEEDGTTDEEEEEEEDGEDATTDEEEVVEDSEEEAAAVADGEGGRKIRSQPLTRNDRRLTTTYSPESRQESTSTHTRTSPLKRQARMCRPD